MYKDTLLIADNYDYYIESLKEFLENEGYDVVTARNPDEARNVLEAGNVSLAVLDIRMEDDDDQYDTSGLQLAKSVAPSIPKIMLTAFPTWQAVAQALGPGLDGLPVAVDFVAKQEGPEALLRSIEWILYHSYLRENLLRLFRVPNIMALDESSDQLKQSLAITTKQLTELLEEERQRASRYHTWGLTMVIIGIVIIFTGALLSMFSIVPLAWLSSVPGVILQVISLLFFRREDAAHKRMSRHQDRLEETYRMTFLLSVYDTITSQEKREEAKLNLIDKIIEKWYTSG